MQRLGHAALVESNYDQARMWYTRVLESDSNNDKSDVWHAMGATYLQQGRFLKAQQVWKHAAEKISQCQNHEGIALQLTKQQAYRYFDDNDRVRGNGNGQHEMPVMLPSYTDILRKNKNTAGLLFVTNTPTVSQATCRQIIDWAESSPTNWTTSRHYAVPTNDVPVHSIPLLLEWFNEWMRNTVYPLLARQFKCCLEEKFYVHDAFVIRYQASQQSNHLPCHYDESTHSLVLTLNDNSEFEGGGTYFMDENVVVNPAEAGTLVSFCGNKLQHGGEVVTKGTRYILAVFLYHDKEGVDDASDMGKDGEALRATNKRRRSNNNSKSNKWETSKESGFSFGFTV